MVNMSQKCRNEAAPVLTAHVEEGGEAKEELQALQEAVRASRWMAPPETLEDYRTYLGRNVIRLRFEASYTKTHLADLLHVSRPFIDRIENGSANPRLSCLHELSLAFDTTIDELLASPPKEHESHRRSPLGLYVE